MRAAALLPPRLRSLLERLERTLEGLESGEIDPRRATSHGKRHRGDREGDAGVGLGGTGTRDRDRTRSSYGGKRKVSTGSSGTAVSLSGRLGKIDGALSPRKAAAMVMREIKREDSGPKAVRDRVTRSMQDHEIKEYNRLVERMQTGRMAAIAAEFTEHEVPHIMQQSFLLRPLDLADDGAAGMDRQMMLASYDQPVTEAEHAIILKKARAETETIETWAEYLVEKEIDEGEKGRHNLIRTKERMLRDLVQTGEFPGETVEGELRISAGAVHDWLGDEVPVMDESGDNPVGEVLPDEASEAARMIRERRRGYSR